MSIPNCLTPGCGSGYGPKRRRGYCDPCYTRLRRAGKFTGLELPEPAALPTESGSVSVNEKGNERDVTTVTTEQVRTLEDLIRVCEIDTDIWEVIEWHANKWEMGYKDALKRAHALPLFQVKARLRRKVELISARQEIAELKALAKLDIGSAKGWSGRIPLSPFSGNMLEIDIFDLHLGKLAWAKETGYENYDLKIARRLFEDALETLIQRTSSHAFELVVLPVGNDFFHSDNLIGETTHGTRQDCEGRFHKTAHIGREMMVHAIERLCAIAPVRVVIAPGNHDQLSAWHLGDSLECWFHQNADVTVDNHPTLRKYVEFGKVMLMFTHGNRGKQADYPLLMATEQPDMWGRTRFREAHLGHLHKTHVLNGPSVSENHGARVRIISSLCATDAWHAEMQFVGNLRQAEAFVWNKDEGQIAHATYTATE